MEQDPSEKQSEINNNNTGVVKMTASRDQVDNGTMQGLTSSKKGTRRTSSCQALKLAVLTLYRLDDFNTTKIGNGFFSDVYKVTHKATGEVMVLKMNTSEDNRPNMLREVQLMNRMTHPNILKFMGVCVHQGQLHALTEYINGGSLHNILCDDRSDSLPWRDRVQIVVDVASGMQYLHSRGLFHRDLTSRVNGEVKRGVVADFGLAAKIPDPDREFMLSVVGSPYWMAPECIQGLPYNESADVFSFGIILCETIARIDADPDELPRTQNFGLDYVAFSELVDGCPLHFLYLSFQCCQMEPKKRPKFTDIHECLIEISKNRIANNGKVPALNQTNLESGYLLQPITKNTSILSHQRSYSEHSSDFLKSNNNNNNNNPSMDIPCAQIIGKHMTVEDPLYEPAPANTNPFAANAQLSAGKKIVASDLERAQTFELSMTLPTAAARLQERMIKNNQKKLSLSLPNSPGIVQRAIEQFNAKIHSSHNQRTYSISANDKSGDTGGDLSVSVNTSDNSCSNYHYSRQNSKQRNLKCAMLFSGLDLIQINRASSSEWSDTQISSDLESEFQDDLEDVLRLSSSDIWDEDDMTLSHTPDSAISDMETEWWLEQADPSCYKYLHPTLVEQRRQLKHVESKQKEKLEQLQMKLEQLRLTARRSSKKSKLSSLS